MRIKNLFRTSFSSSNSYSKDYQSTLFQFSLLLINISCVHSKLWEYFFKSIKSIKFPSWCPKIFFLNLTYVIHIFHLILMILEEKSVFIFKNWATSFVLPVREFFLSVIGSFIFQRTAKIEEVRLFFFILRYHLFYSDIIIFLFFSFSKDSIQNHLHIFSLYSI